MQTLRVIRPRKAGLTLRALPPAAQTNAAVHFAAEHDDFTPQFAIVRG
ncbi:MULTISPECIES: hypothetical protein [Xanthomonas]|uniref:Uncharacterized protein n=1 Tax=Xanthomonas dyei TaxID=743699 RepID=A0ABZ0DB98_9XANT|nr:hypothetical protein [Xanthomonas dyei]MCC4634571.1 hypothetical protein [Xanthomonas dyei pv. eucalypti]WOB25593.1 hypothetical protein NYR99_18040 [Xanthomonas dyei]WOB53219.1 hypothetical protein NYR95_18045 [Xanthomonas dyei]